MGYITLDTVAVMRFIAKAPRPVYGREIHLDLGMASGVLYPILRRLDLNGLVKSQWEASKPPKRPRRRYYEITKEGLDWLSAVEHKYP